MEIVDELLVEVFHRGGTEDDKEADPKRGSLEGDRFISFFFAFCCVIGLEEHSIKEDGEIFRMVLDPATGLRSDDLIDIVEVDASGKQQDDEQDARDFLVMLIEHIGDRLDLFLGDRFLQPRGHCHDEKRESADPDDCGQQVEPMIDDRDERIEVCDNALKSVHKSVRR